jgi:hypothetical protein
VPLVIWGAMLLVLTAAQLPFGPTTPEVALLGAAGAACLVAGLMLLRLRSEPRRSVPALSPGAVVVAFGLGGLLVGAEAGAWLMYVGGGTTLLGLALLRGEAR